MRKLKKIFNYQARFFFTKLYDASMAEIMDKLCLEIDDFLINAKAIYKNQVSDVTTVAMIQIEQRFLVIKRYNFRNLLHALKLQFRQSHAFRSFNYAVYLSKLGIPSIKPAAIIQKKVGIIKLRSYFVSYYEQGVPGCVYFKDDSIFKDSWQKTRDEIYDTIAKLRQAKIYHGDFHFGNFVIVDSKPILLDFDHVRQVKINSHYKSLHNKDLKNFYRYLVRNKAAFQLFKQHPDFNLYFENVI